MGELGLGREALATICEILNMLPPVSDSAKFRAQAIFNAAKMTPPALENLCLRIFFVYCIL